MKYIKYRWDSQEWKDQHREMAKPKLEWYDRIIADLIRMRTQGSNIKGSTHFETGISIVNRKGRIMVYERARPHGSDDFYACTYTDYIEQPLYFGTVQEAIEFDWKIYSETHKPPVYMT